MVPPFPRRIDAAALLPPQALTAPCLPRSPQANNYTISNLSLFLFDLSRCEMWLKKRDDVGLNMRACSTGLGTVGAKATGVCTAPYISCSKSKTRSLLYSSRDMA